MTLVDSERAALADTLAAVGPDAPTLCAGWTTTDLALHLVLRDRLDPAIRTGGLPGPLDRLGDRLERRRRKVLARHGYLGLVDQFRTGPPRVSLLTIPLLARLANTVEFFVHHEDVLRAQPGNVPRDLPLAAQEELLKGLRQSARPLLRHCPAGVTARLPDGRDIVLRKGEPAAVLEGEPAEVLLYLMGRRPEARVRLSGDAGAREALANARLAF